MSEPTLTTVPPVGSDKDGWAYHLRGGFYFRGVGGAVTISVKCGDDSYREVTVAPNEWASAVAAVSARGDVQSAWRDALDLHEKTG